MGQKAGVMKDIISAAAEGDLAQLRELFESDGDVNRVIDGVSAMTQACRSGRIDVVRWLIAMGADVNQSEMLAEPALHNAVRSRHLGLVQLLLAEGADPNLRSSAYGEVALTLAIGSQEPGISIMLLEAGADFALAHPMGLAKVSPAVVVNAITQQPEWFRKPVPNGEPFLHAMAFWGGMEYIERAISQGIDVLGFARDGDARRVL